MWLDNSQVLVLVFVDETGEVIGGELRFDYVRHGFGMSYSTGWLSCL